MTHNVCHPQPPPKNEVVKKRGNYEDSSSDDIGKFDMKCVDKKGKDVNGIFYDYVRFI